MIFINKEYNIMKTKIKQKDNLKAWVIIAFGLLLLTIGLTSFGQNVGISDQAGFTPQSIFHIYKNSGASTLMQLSNATSTSGINRGLTFDVDGSFNIGINDRENTSLSLYTNNTERLRIPNTGEKLSVGDGTVSAPAWSFVNNTNMGLYRNASNDMRITIGGVDRMRFGIAAGGTAEIWTNLVSPYVGDVFSSTSNTDGDYGVNGYNTLATATFGGGVYGETRSNNCFATWGANLHTTGTGVAGGGNGYPVTFFTAVGSGGAFSGKQYGAFAYGHTYYLNPTTDITNTVRLGDVGTTYNLGGTWAGLLGSNDVNINAATNTYHFGVHGDVYNWYSATPTLARRIGGVLGTLGNYTNRWACLGYINSAGATYGLYYVNAGTGAGKSTSITVDGIGSGGYGELIGSWTRGGVYGMIVKGERYSLYVDGKTYTNNIIAQLSESNKEDLTKGETEKIVSYVTTSTTVDVYTRGTGTLVNGSVGIKFDNNFNELISSENITITVTPNGECNGVYVTNITKDGFIVKELQNGTSNVTFSWIAVGIKYGYEKPENPKEILKTSYDKNMDKVMFNEGNTEESALPLWWDVTNKKLNFTEIPSTITITKDITLTKSVIKKTK